MEEKPKEDEDRKEARIKEMKMFIENVKERKAKLREELISKDIDVDDDSNPVDENKLEENLTELPDSTPKG